MRQRTFLEPIRFARTIIASLIICYLGGCRSKEPNHDSHFDHDHVVAAHWPDDLDDVVAKLRAEIATIDDQRDDQEKSIGRLRDIINWTPEIAADSELSEQQWISIANTSDGISRQLGDDEHQLSNQRRNDVLHLCDLIEKTNAKRSKESQLAETN
ncbi:hypothetical protein LOC67_17480 [Stieleria sp. JC731]|uniref:hypothetical protein n=1 Tax=Pirellulaceae TaxID=2691357 RepID=UPI001E5E8383|nr:hypothetical protein [Stieleria sp. JC731]MCC9602349.1 hypothetical protein [Stieleria sp. JC731]